MRFLRRWTRFILIFLVLTPILFAARVAVWPTIYFSKRLDRRLRRRLLQCWTWGFARIAGIRVVTEGTPPTPPFYIVANHISYLDMLLLTHQSGSIFVSRGDVEHWPIIGFLASSLYIIFIDRQSRRDTVRVNRLIDEALQLGDGIAVFAESRISVGLDVEPFKSSLIEPAVANKIPVHYATLTYETLPGCPPASQIIAWWRPEPFFTHLLRLFSYPGLTATLRFGLEPIAGDDRKELAQKLGDAVRALYVPMR
jgi:1-acyl-sn-glycerol-3-phosphate acyltransferase